MPKAAKSLICRCSNCFIENMVQLSDDHCCRAFQNSSIGEVQHRLYRVGKGGHQVTVPNQYQLFSAYVMCRYIQLTDLHCLCLVSLFRLLSLACSYQTRLAALSLPALCMNAAFAQTEHLCILACAHPIRIKIITAGTSPVCSTFLELFAADVLWSIEKCKDRMRIVISTIVQVKA